MRAKTNAGPWTDASVADRAKVLGRVPGHLAAAAEDLIDDARSPLRRDVETVSAELIPLADGIAWLAKNAARILADRTVGVRGRPVWLWGVHSTVQRRPLGHVLILGTWNYPILLAGIQTAQALVAGNRVTIKPAAGTEAVTRRWVEAFFSAGVPEGQIRLLDSSTRAATDAIDAGVDLIILTGAAATGRAVARRAAETLTPCILELSGCDAVIVLPTADTDRLVNSLFFGLRFNSGATCIGPRRLIPVDRRPTAAIESLVQRLREAGEVAVHPAAAETAVELIESAIADGAVDLVGQFRGPDVRRTGRMPPVVLDNVAADHPVAAADVFAPVMSILPATTLDDAVDQVNACRYRLAASVFGDRRAATAVAHRLDVGSVTVNDLIAPTADPRLPFGGRGHSGYGVTQGPEGLLAMTHPRSVSVRRGWWLPHLDPPRDGDASLLTAVLQLAHRRGGDSAASRLRRLASAAGRRGPVS